MGWRRKQRKLIISTTIQSLEERSEISKPPQRLKTPEVFSEPPATRPKVLLIVMNGMLKDTAR